MPFRRRRIGEVSLLKKTSKVMQVRNVSSDTRIAIGIISRKRTDKIWQDILQAREPFDSLNTLYFIKH